jgi:hypothetical protein
MDINDAPVFSVVMMTVFAPLASSAAIIVGLGTAIKWLVTYRPKDE